MTTAELASILKARRTGPGKWIAKCPAHEDHDPSLTLAEGDDGRTLLRCWAGCRTDDVLRSLGLAWQDLFLESRGIRHRLNADPVVDEQRREAAALREWAERMSRRLRDELFRRQCYLTKAEKILAEDPDREAGWHLLHVAYAGTSMLEYLVELLDSKRPENWNLAREFLS